MRPSESLMGDSFLSAPRVWKKDGWAGAGVEDSDPCHEELETRRLETDLAADQDDDGCWSGAELHSTTERWSVSRDDDILLLTLDHSAPDHSPEDDEQGEDVVEEIRLCLEETAALFCLWEMVTVVLLAPGEKEEFSLCSWVRPDYCDQEISVSALLWSRSVPEPPSEHQMMKQRSSW